MVLQLLRSHSRSAPKMAPGVVSRSLPSAPTELHTTAQILDPGPRLITPQTSVDLQTLVLLPTVKKKGHIVEIDHQISRSRGCRAKYPSLKQLFTGCVEILLRGDPRRSVDQISGPKGPSLPDRCLGVDDGTVSPRPRPPLVLVKVCLLVTLPPLTEIVSHWSKGQKSIYRATRICLRSSAYNLKILKKVI